jgi:hypothetical protein
MELRKLVRTNRRENRRILLISELGRRQDQLLRARQPDLEALEQLADDYDAAGLYIAGAVGLRCICRSGKTRGVLRSVPPVF